MAETPPRIVVAGSANMDLVGLAPRLPAPGETVLGDDFVMTPGGKGANQAIAAVRAGGRYAARAAPPGASAPRPEPGPAPGESGPVPPAGSGGEPPAS